ncbi:hypothetical protein EDD28_0302 [Salana multivorans]|uniref:LGFP repeat-containing protein n=1 Tax=Salana multivorans TaxID=120377 RepID=A0A3N2D7I5_9MICO|nr:hypothetical protein [Salana multivorans]ROR95740.1 hypothetical protein EDD28_0302 [Salana multivorans]
MTVRAGRSLTLLLTAVLVSAAALVAPVLPGGPATAEAADGKDYDPGYIISDENFYDGNAMTAQEVQTFLNSKGTSCVAGEQPCIKSWQGPTVAKAKDSYCNGYAAGTQTAAEIIAGVGKSCGISQKALVVLLQKEQSLITRTKPTNRAYQIATGYGCPDGQPCDAEYYGFFNQVYRAAWQYKVYKSRPTSYGFQAGRVNTIPYNFKASCGSGPVYIQNEATRALYIYTPFQANEAILKNIYGNGDSCTSFAQINTWTFWSDWFGSPTGIAHAYPVEGGILSTWTAHGGVAGPGVSTGPITWSTANGGGWYQNFTNGIITHTATGVGAYHQHGTGITTAWKRAGAQDGTWGWPLTQETCTNGTCQITYTNVIATWTATTGTTTQPRHPYEVSGGIAGTWNKYGGLAGPGLSTGPITWSTANGGGWYQNFTNGIITHTATGVGAYHQHGTGITTAWKRAGAQDGTWGWPLTQETCTNGTCQITYTNVIATWTATTGTTTQPRHPYEVSGGIAGTWNKYGGLAGPGLSTGPITWSTANGGGWYQNFTNGIITHTATGVGAYHQHGTGITTAWKRAGAQDGTWGWPLTQETCTNGTCQITYTNVIATWTATTGTTTQPRHPYEVSGGIAGTWNKYGGLAGPGLSTGPITWSTANGGGWYQNFTNGIITHTATGVGAYHQHGTGITTAWKRAGAQDGTWGWPLTQETCTNGTCQITYTNVIATWTATTGTTTQPRAGKTSQLSAPSAGRAPDSTSPSDRATTPEESASPSEPASPQASPSPSPSGPAATDPSATASPSVTSSTAD